MNRIVKAIIALALFIAFMAGAYFLYNYLSAKRGDAAESTTETTAESTTEKPEETTKSTNETTTQKSTENTTETTTAVSTTGKPQFSAPDFTVLTYDGTKVKLSDFAGKPIVINFWASWCSPCKSELPYFENAYFQFEDEVVFLMVNLTDGSRDTVSGVKSFIKTYGYTFPVYFDTAGSAASAYGVYSIPETVFIKRDGSVYKRQVGGMTLPQLVNNIKGITGDN